MREIIRFKLEEEEDEETTNEWREAIEKTKDKPKKQDHDKETDRSIPPRPDQGRTALQC
jgi:hypothetical protein